MVLKKDRLNLYVGWILQAISKIEEYTKGFDFAKFEQKDAIVDGCLMQLIHLGETANSIRKKYPDFDKIPYDFVVGLRNFIAHDYVGVRKVRIWNTIKNDLPALKKDLMEYMKKSK